MSMLHFYRYFDLFYEGEFILYRHAVQPYSVNAFFRACPSSINGDATCNCAVSIQSGDDVIVIDR